MDFILHIIALIGMWIPGSLGLNLILGKGKILYFGPIGSSLISTYTMVLVVMATGSYTIALVACIIATALISVFFAWLSLRLEADSFGVMSIAVHLSILAVILNWSSLTRGALGIANVPRMPFLNSVGDFAIASVIIGVVSVLFMWRVHNSSFGRQLSALAEHEFHATSLGINRARVHLLAFLIGGIGVILGNVLVPQYLKLLHPNDFMFPGLIFYVMMVVSGMPGSIWGVTLSSILLVLLKEALRFVPLAPSILGPVRLILFGLILFGAVWWRRDILFPHERKV